MGCGCHKQEEDREELLVQRNDCDVRTCDRQIILHLDNGKPVFSPWSCNTTQESMQKTDQEECGKPEC